MVKEIEQALISQKSYGRSLKSERMKFVKWLNKMEHKMRHFIKLMIELEVQASTKRKTSVIIKDCAFIIIGKYCVISLFGLCYLNELFMDHYYYYYYYY